MQLDTAEAHGGRVPRKSRYTPERVDARTRVGRRAARLCAYYTSLLDAAGRPTTSPDLATNILAAAELTALVEHQRARMLRGHHVPLDDLTALQRLADASVRRLGLPSSQSPPAPLSLRERLVADASGVDA